MTNAAAALLQKELAKLKKTSTDGFSAGLIDDDDIFKWQILLMGPPDTPFEGGCFTALLEFPKNFPLRPPKMKFLSEMWHPNVSEDGEVCISILHDPGEDKYGYESPEERWLPVRSVESVITSVRSMLAEPNCDSPANVDAAKQYREERGAYLARINSIVRKTQE